ncbi:MAG TPA: ABC transporter permease [Blastocatellia bacterium]|nr:ABC transporter permease [Blastocatellia bacterium]
MQTLLQDVRYGWRMLLKRPGFTFVAVLTLALGIGANTAIFSVVYGVLLRPLPFAHQESLIVAWKKDTTATAPFVELSPAEFKDWQAASQSFAEMAAMPTTAYGYGYVLTGGDEAVQLESSKVTGGFFSLLGAQPALGRVLDENDDQVNAPKVAVLSDRLWRTTFNADPEIIGRTLTLTGQGFTVVGVMPPQFEFPRGVDLWVPLTATMNPRVWQNRGAIFLQAVGRLKPGVTREQAEAELNTVIASIAEQHPETAAAGHRVVITPLAEHLFGDARPALWLLLAATALLLLIASANIANLLLARATSRRREFALRTALGASRWQIIRQLLTESLVLAVIGGGLGLLLAHWLVDLLIQVAPADVPRINEVRLSLPALAFSALVTLSASLMFGLIPALAASRLNLSETLNEGSSRLSGDRAGKRLRQSLIVAEIAITMVLLAGAALILRSFMNLSRVDLGLEPRNVLTMQLRLTGARYGKPEARREFFSRLVERLESQPGVVAAGGVLIRPLEGTVGWEMDYALEGQPLDEARRNTVANFEVVTPHYFRAMNIAIKAGREFAEQDRADTERVVIVSESMARQLFGSAEAAVGKRIKLEPASADEPLRTIVAVAGDVRYRELRDVRWDVYVPHAQSAVTLNHFAVRTATEATAFLPVVRREVAALDATQAIAGVATVEQLLATNLSRPRFSALLLNCLAGLALLLAGVGIYGVVAYSVAQRTAELGIRVALGAQTKDILRLVIREGMTVTLLGVGVGALAAALLTRLINDLLFAVSATDPLTFAAIALTLAGVALAACYLPARRATRVDPMVALRYE